MSAQPVTSPSCSAAAQQTQEIQRSDEKRTQLKAAWDEKWTALTKNGPSVQGVTIPPDVETKVKTMLRDLEPYVKWHYAAQGSVAAACKHLKDPRGKGNHKTNQMKNVCKVFVQVVHWMGNLDKYGKKKNGMTKEDDWKQYLRCVIGYEFLLRVLLPKYKVEDFMDVIFKTMKGGGTEGALSSMGGICSWVKINDVKEMEELIGDEVQKWLNEAKGDWRGGRIMGFHNIIAWSRYTDEKEKQQAKAKQKTQTCNSDRIMDLFQAGESGKLENIVPPLPPPPPPPPLPPHPPPPPENCIKDKNGLCERVSCVINKWVKNNTITSGKPNGQAGSPPWNDFWEKHINVKLQEMFTAMTNTNSSSNVSQYCNTVGEDNSAERKVCGHFAAGLEAIYKIAPGSAKHKDDDQLLHRTMMCAALNAYADQLITKANGKKSNCKVKEGIDGAFEKSQNIKDKTPPCSTDGDKCIKCERKSNFSCDITQKEVEAEWNKLLAGTKTEMSSALSSIDTLCQPPPVPPPSAPSIPASSTSSSSSSNSSGSSSSSSGAGSTAPGGAAAPAAKAKSSTKAGRKGRIRPTSPPRGRKGEGWMEGFPSDSIHPYLPLVPSILGIMTITYFLWKYFGPLGKGGPRFRRSPAEIPGPSVQEQVLDHVQQEAGPHEYRLVKERKPRSSPTRTKRSGRVNRRTIIEIHFEVLDECQKGNTQLAQKDFLELLVQEFMGSEFMEVEQFPMENVLMESLPMERVSIEEVPSLGSGLMV
ncbi:SICAvar, type I (fragment) [Plasmodium knowlesi strain H]|uniref:SICAvar, type I n=2 Tax=Plasmodium knowlesi (strain H) TaxID=5851 RepID=A0A1A7VFX6_PLAKH